MNEAASIIVIAGGGQAAGTAVCRLRQLGYRGRLVLITDEQALPYERPGLSKAFLLGEMAGPRAILAAAQANERILAGTRVVGLDRARREVLTSAGAIAYDRLLLATGAQPRRLAVAGADLPGIHVLRSALDAARIAADLEHCRAHDATLLVVGGSWIGLEIAAAARRRGVRVVLLEQGERLCRRSLPASIAARLQALHEAHGVEIRLNTEVVGFAGEARVRHAALSDGSALAVGAVVVGIGAAPDLHFVRQAQLAVRQGIVVDALGRSADPFIYAAGDVAETRCEWQNMPVRYECWASANHQAQVAADSMLRDQARADLPASAPAPVPWFWSDQYDASLQIAGAPLLADACEAIADDAQGFAHGFYRGGRLIGAVAIGHARAFRDLRRRIEPIKPPSCRPAPATIPSQPPKGTMP